MSDIIYARKGSLTTQFTRFNWNNTKDKNGWEEISFEEYGALSKMGAATTAVKANLNAKKPEETEQTEAYQKLMFEAESLKESYKYVEALAAYERAQKVKNTRSVKTRITKLKKVIQAETGEKVEESVAELMLKEANELFKSAQFEQAKEMYESLKLLDATYSDVANEKIALCEKVNTKKDEG